MYAILKYNGTVVTAGLRLKFASWVYEIIYISVMGQLVPVVPVITHTVLLMFVNIEQDSKPYGHCCVD